MTELLLKCIQIFKTPFRGGALTQNRPITLKGTNVPVTLFRKKQHLFLSQFSGVCKLSGNFKNTDWLICSNRLMRNEGFLEYFE